MDSRYLTETITVFRSTSSTRGVGGQIIKTWSSYIDVMGSFQNASGIESIINNQNAFRKTKKFYCNIVDILDTDQIVYDGKYYQINNVSNIWDHHLEIDMQIRSTS